MSIHPPDDDPGELHERAAKFIDIIDRWFNSPGYDRDKHSADDDFRHDDDGPVLG